ncbi:hypothetical protein HL653_05975 [Sphingomonas sp. AP4-R1]|uniref:DUF6118 family protein n=1 Tax=Sphingomonas sp. AP4-R1 TaxID=2735134 RepID=UPI001493B17F|nr:DUF6118 family protein [Sphingomonas sp. AP4-R1]QJU57399.1 hypothetical protein HL653_05975 [Sphingomonas sp. AP4-R1]
MIAGLGGSYRNMDQDSTPRPDASLAEHAFGELRGEISLLRRAIERLTDERISQSDYTPSLEELSKRLDVLTDWARSIAKQPALQLTPEKVGRGIADAGMTHREADRQLLQRAVNGMDASVSHIDGLIARARNADAQDRELRRNRIAFGVSGMLLFSILPGAIARSLPVSWAIPERIAARMLGTDMWHAGQDMMVKADPDSWRRIVGRDLNRPGHSAK